MIRKKFIIKISVKILIIFLIAILTGLIIYFLSGVINKKNTSMREKKDMDYLIQNQGEINLKIKTDFAKVDPAYDVKITNSLPSVYNILNFVDALDSIAKKNSLGSTINFSQPVPATDAPGALNISKINFSLTLNNINVDSFNNYLKDFESLPYFATINTISIVASGKLGWQDNSVISLSGSFYARQ